MGLFNFLKPKPQKSAPVKQTQSKKIENVVSKDPEIRKLQRDLKAQDRQLEKIKRAESYFKETGDIDYLIEFWENIWKNGGLLFNGAYWTFRLPDLYIKLGRYDDAIKILNMITNPFYAEKRQKYLEKISALKTRNKESK